MSIPIDDVRPGWYWIQIVGDFQCVEVFGKDRKVCLVFNDDVFDVTDFEFIERIDPPEENK